MTHPTNNESPLILIVEDDPLLAGLVARLLDRNGLRNETAVDGQDAVERLAAKSYDGIILDLMMPRLDGFGVIDWLRVERAPLLGTVIVMTATSDQQLSRLRVNELGGLIRKPFEIHELGGMLRTILALPEGDTAGAASARENLLDRL